MEYLERVKNDKPLLVTIAILILVILVLIYVLRQKQTYFHEFLNGVWNMDEEFCQESGLHSGYIAIENDSAYILLHIEGEEAINEPIKICGNHKFNPSLSKDNDIYITITSENEIIKDLYPERMHCIVNLLEGVMIWKNGDETLAIFYKINSS